MRRAAVLDRCERAGARLQVRTASAAALATTAK
jgi:hypothetical protein